jgi:D-alanyl-D-alanine carboxypeptidase
MIKKQLFIIAIGTVLISSSSIHLITNAGANIENKIETASDQLSMTQRLEDFLQVAMEMDHFSGVVMVVHRGNVLLNRGYGMATFDDENEQDTVMHVASITKQFTAAAIMKLWEAGTIDLNASINTYLPEEYQSDTWEKVTVHHLLSHTSGVVDYDESYYNAETKSFCFNDTIKAMISESQRKGLEFEPGTEWRYSNIGYSLLGAILENITGLSYGEVIRKSIFDEVGMSSSTIHDENYIAKREHAIGHRWDKKKKKLVEDGEKCLPVTPSDGGLVTTSEDLHKWSNVLAGKRPDVLSPAILKRMTTPVLNSSTPDGYGYGLFIDDSTGMQKIHHPGWIEGFRSHFCFYPEKEIYISVFCNNSTTNPLQITSGLSEIMEEKDRSS